MILTSQNAQLHAAAAAANAAQQTAVASVTSLLQERDRLLRENGDLRQEVARLQVRQHSRDSIHILAVALNQASGFKTASECGLPASPMRSHINE